MQTVRSALIPICLIGAFAVACGDDASEGVDASMTPRDGSTTFPPSDGSTSGQDAGGSGQDGSTTGQDGGGTGQDGSTTGNDAGPGADAQTGQDAGSGQDAQPGQDGSTGDGGMISTTCDPNFGMAEACAGDLVGSWTYQSACTNTNLFGVVTNICAQSTFSNTAYSTSGTLTLNMDGTFVRDVNTAASTDFQMPSSCIMGAACSVIEDGVEAFLNGTTTCVDNAGGCDCTTTVPIVTQDSGTYSTNGGIATILPSAGGTYDYYYCTDSNTLLYRGAMAPADTSFTYVLTK